MKKLLQFLSWMTIIVSGCSDENTIDFSLMSPTQNVITRAGGDGLYDVLGMSYDATTTYLSDIAVRLPVIDCSLIKNYYINCIRK